MITARATHKKYTKKYFLYFFLVVLIIYQDGPLQTIFGNAGMSFLPLLSLILMCTEMIKSKKKKIGPLSRTFFRIFFYCFIVSYLAILVWGITGGSMTLYGEYLPVKALKGLLSILAYPCFIHVLSCTLQKLDEKEIFTPIIFVLILLALVCLVESMQIPNAFPGIHFSQSFPYYRIRLLTRESSWTSVMIYNYSILSIYYAIKYKKTILMIISGVCAVILLWTSGSKTLMLIFGITVAILLLLSNKSRKRILTSVLVFVVGFYAFYHYILPRLQTSFLSDITNYSSTPSRIYMNIMALIIGCIIPTGVGTAVYLGVFPSLLSKYLDTFRSILPFNFNTSAFVYQLTTDTESGLTAKSGMTQGNMIWGIFGTFFIMREMVRIYKKIAYSKDKYVSILKVTWIVNMIFVWFSNDFSYEFFLAIIILDVIASRDLGDKANLEPIISERRKQA